MQQEKYQEFRKSLKHLGPLMCDKRLGQISFKSDKFGRKKTKLEFWAPKDFDIFRTLLKQLSTRSCRRPIEHNVGTS